MPELHMEKYRILGLGSPNTFPLQPIEELARPESEQVAWEYSANPALGTALHSRQTEAAC